MRSWGRPQYTGAGRFWAEFRIRPGQKGNLKKKGSKANSTFRRNLVLVFGGFILFVLVFPMVFGEMGFLQYVEMQKNRQNMEFEIERLKLENEKLEEKISGLRSDPETIERVARERLGLVRPGEVVFQLKGSGEKPRDSGP